MHNSVGKIFKEAAEHSARVLESRVDGRPEPPLSA